MARRAKPTDSAPDALVLARRLREGVVNDPDFAVDDVPTARGPGIFEPNVEFHLNGPEGRRYKVLVVRSS